MAEHLSPLDAMFLELEQADDSAHMHIGAVTVFDPAPGGCNPALADLRERLEERLDPLPRFRQRLSSARTGGMSWPTWESDPNFDIRDHLRHATLPAPGGDDELIEWTRRTSTPTGLTAVDRCGRRCFSTGSRMGAGHSLPRVTVALAWIHRIAGSGDSGSALVAVRSVLCGLIGG
jgi:hypothetical protein